MPTPTTTTPDPPAMTASPHGDRRADQPTEHVDVLIVGAGLSGIGAASQLRMNSPERSFAILEARDAIGGTWDLFRYPGIRSDSDMYTLGFSFRPWEQPEALADGPSILSYINDTAREFDVEREVRFGHRVVRAEWSSEDARWTLDVERSDGGGALRMTCGFLHLCTGYYRYDEGFTPEFEGAERFEGEIVHPQLWPEDLDYTHRRVVVIGSGATAVTLVPAMADRADHVTMLQRSPSYVISLPARDPIAERLNRWLPAKLAYQIMRWKQAMLATVFYKACRRAPGLISSLIRRGVQRQLPRGYDVDTHFAPSYDPWDQRVCLVPDGDLFEALSAGDASIVTDRIESFTEKGLKLRGGDELEADIVITATGLNVLLFGDMEIAVDGREIDFSETVSYKGMMICGVPNLAYALGYTNASWTLKCDLVSGYVCRLVNHMHERGYSHCTPRGPDPSLPTEPFIDLKSGYVQRAIDKLPKQGNKAPWRLHQNYSRDLVELKYGGLDDDAMEFTRAASADRVAAAA